jgi:hypothetical protein|tara:strand:- start:31256 stop:31528 length:273 start_codon:yes stop_codon:yes gene_type:complete
MFILSDASTGGVYAVTPKGKQNPKGPKAVQIFVDKDDAVRYNLMLEANDYSRKLDVLEVDFDLVVQNCLAHRYDYVIVKPNQVVVPPEDD